jgi:hypothetical protein
LYHGSCNDWWSTIGHILRLRCGLWLLYHGSCNDWWSTIGHILRLLYLGSSNDRRITIGLW